MKDFTFTFKTKNFESLNRLFKFQISKYNDLYLFPSVPSSSRLAHSDFHISFHASGESHLKMNFPLACLHLGPKLKLPFNRTQFLEDVVASRNSLLTRIDLSNETRGGLVAVLDAEVMIKTFLKSKYIRDRLENPKFIDYYNLVLTNPYRPSSDFKEFFPYKELEIDAKTIEDSIKIYEGENLYKLLIELKNNNIIRETDLVTLAPYDGSFMVIMSGNFIGLRINFYDIEESINKLPGAKTFYSMIKRLARDS